MIRKRRSMWILPFSFAYNCNSVSEQRTHVLPSLWCRLHIMNVKANKLVIYSKTTKVNFYVCAQVTFPHCIDALVQCLFNKNQTVVEPFPDVDVDVCFWCVLQCVLHCFLCVQWQYVSVGFFVFQCVLGCFYCACFNMCCLIAAVEGGARELTCLAVLLPSLMHLCTFLPPSSALPNNPVCTYMFL